MRRTIDDVRALIDGAEYQFASMSIPYTLAIYKELVVSALRMLQEDEVDTSSEDIHQLGLHDAQEHLIQFLDPAHIPHDELALLDFLRRLRNRIEHRGGIEGSSLRGAFQALSPSARQTWTTLAERPFESMGHTQPMRLDARELIATLAITTRLARAINRNLQVTLSRAYWARVAIRDFRRTSPKGWSQKDLRLRKARNFADHQYSALRLTEIELREAIATEES